MIHSAPGRHQPMRITPLEPPLVERILAAWSLDELAAAPSRRLDQLHRACLRHVPFENLTKLIHRQSAPRLEAARRHPPVFWREHLEIGAGGTCFATTEGFASLLIALGYTVRPIFCHLPAERRHAHVALLVETETGPRLCDTGYALAAPMPLPGRLPIRRRTRHYDMEMRAGVDGEYLLFLEDDRGRRFRYQFRDAAASRAEWIGAWNESLKPAAIYMNRLALGRFGAGVRWILHPDNRVMVLSRHNERAIVMPADEDAADRRLSRLFRLPVSLIQAARGALRDARGRATSGRARPLATPRGA